ncbi:hypothetical protein [Acinetobacter soli]|uniref:hypothetical protein n=1 Tax=Acinetobacter soli TaxID=487316 RepID=UPI00125F7236|nr:hypothetical protein [Acinetobacter soli]
MANSKKGFNSFSHKADSDKENSVLLQTNEKTNEQSPQKIPPQTTVPPASEQKDKGVQPDHNTPKTNPN